MKFHKAVNGYIVSFTENNLHIAACCLTKSLAIGPIYRYRCSHTKKCKKRGVDQRCENVSTKIKSHIVHVLWYQPFKLWPNWHFLWLYVKQDRILLLFCPQRYYRTKIWESRTRVKCTSFYRSRVSVFILPLMSKDKEACQKDSFTTCYFSTIVCTYSAQFGVLCVRTEL